MKLEKLLSSTLNQRKHIPLANLKAKAKKAGINIGVNHIGYWIEGSSLEDDTWFTSKEELLEKLNKLGL